MSELREELRGFAQQVGSDVKGLNTKLGEPSTLKTADKSNLVSAINELFDNVATATAGQSNLTNADVGRIVKAEIAKLIDGAPEAADTLKELADLIANNTSGLSSFTAAINNRLRIDEQQTLTAEQKTNVQKSLGIHELLANTDILSVYSRAKNGM